MGRRAARKQSAPPPLEIVDNARQRPTLKRTSASQKRSSNIKKARKISGNKGNKLSDAANTFSVDGVGSDEEAAFSDGNDAVLSDDDSNVKSGLHLRKSVFSSDEDASDASEALDMSANDESETPMDSEIEDSGAQSADSSDIEWSEDDEADVDGLTAANMEALSTELDRQRAVEEQSANDEFQQSIQSSAKIVWDNSVRYSDSDAEVDAESSSLPRQLSLNERHWQIQQIVRILQNWSNKDFQREPVSRAQYVQQLIIDICSYYEYSPFLAEKLFTLFSPQEAFEFFESNEQQRPVTIRVNTLKTNKRTLVQALTNRGMNIKSLGKWTPDGLLIFDSKVPIGATPEYLAGHYMLQAVSSLLPVMALDPQPNERILDMSSAPGGKITHVAALQRNTGLIVANDANRKRCNALVANIHRMGIKNVIVSNYDGRKFPEKVMGGFNKVILDAPCSGTGVISKDPSVKRNKTENDFKILSHLQRQLLLCAIDSADAANGNGVIVYSTCSVSIEENEAVVDYALRKRSNVRLIDTGLKFGRPGFTSFMAKKMKPQLSLSRRFFPHVHNMDGFFVAKFVKISNKFVHPQKTAATALTKAEIDDDANGAEEPDIANDFSLFNDSEDMELIRKNERAQIRRKGLKPSRKRQI